MTTVVRAMFSAAVVCAAWAFAVPAQAATETSNPCALLTAAQVGAALGGSYGAPSKSPAARPFPNSGPGTDCHYEGRPELLFRIYYDDSASTATGLFAKLKMYFGSGPAAPGIGDEAYFDQGGALHARKGKVRFYLDAGKGKQAALTKLGQIVAGEL